MVKKNAKELIESNEEKGYETKKYKKLSKY